MQSLTGKYKKLISIYNKVKEFIMRSNWRTTVAGLCTAAIACIAAGRAIIDGESPDWAVTIAAVTAAWGLLFAKDAKN